MSEEKPLHVLVAEALGWASSVPGLVYIEPPRIQWLGLPPDYDGTSITDLGRFTTTLTGVGIPIPAYDTDWSVTGPLIEKYGFELNHLDSGGWAAWRWRTKAKTKEGATPLEAVCRLIVALAAEGKLEEQAATFLHRQNPDGSWERISK